MSDFNVEHSPRYRLAALSRLWTSSTEKIYEARFGMSLSEWRIVAIVGTEGPINASAIADRGLLEKSHISRLVARLVEQGLIDCAPDHDDARRTWLTLTPEGRKKFDATAAISLERDALFLSALAPRERETFARLVDKLLVGAEALRG